MASMIFQGYKFFEPALQLSDDDGNLHVKVLTSFLRCKATTQLIVLLEQIKAMIIVFISILDFVFTPATYSIL